MSDVENVAETVPRMGWIPGSILIAVAILTTVYQLGFSSLLPTDEDYQEVVSKIATDEDASVLVVPMWAERIRTMVDNPVVGLPPDDRDLEPIGRLWVLVTPGPPWGHIDRDMEVLDRRFGPPKHTSQHGGLTLLKYEFEAKRPAFRFLDHLSTATVKQAGRLCRLTENDTKHQCQRAGWNHVAVQVREFQYLPRTCMWAHPVTNEPLTISFPNVPVGESIEVRAGLVGRTGLDERLAPVQIDVEVAGIDVGKVVAPPRQGYPLTSIPTPSAAGKGTVTFTVTTPNQGRRHFCFDAWIPDSGAARE